MASLSRLVSGPCNHCARWILKGQAAAELDGLLYCVRCMERLAALFPPLEVLRRAHLTPPDVPGDLLPPVKSDPRD